MSSRPRFVLEAGFLKARIDRVSGLRPQRGIGVHECRDLGLAQLETAVTEVEQRPLGGVKELAAKLFVGDQPANDDLDDPLRHVHRLSRACQGQVAHRRELSGATRLQLAD